MYQMNLCALIANKKIKKRNNKRRKIGRKRNDKESRATIEKEGKVEGTNSDKKCRANYMKCKLYTMELADFPSITG